MSAWPNEPRKGSLQGFVNGLLVAFFGCVLVLVGWWCYDIDEARQRRHDAWIDMQMAAGCKRTSFAGRDMRPVWTCPDGNAFLEPAR